MKILVTGGAGFIGSHIVDTLVKNGYSVRVVDNLSSGKKENLNSVWSKITFIEGDIRDKATVKDAVNGVDSILHLAALRSVPRSMAMPCEYNEVNVDGTLNLLIAARDAKVKKFVFTSSSSVYGDTEKLPQVETDPLQPISPYAMTKLMGEQYCKLFYKAYGLETVSLRYFNVFGPRQSLEDEYAVVIPKFITCMLQGKRPPIYGDGLQSRDFTYVSNIVEANLAALRASKTSGEVYNVAAGEAKTVIQLVETLNELIGSDLAPEFHPLRPGDVKHTLADPAKILKGLEWKCGTNFKDGLEITLKWFKYL